MRKYLILMCAVFAVFACGKFEPEVETPEIETPEESGIPASDIVFDFTVNYPDGTKATKQGWENGDAVFVFLQGYTGFYVKLTYNGSEWASAIGPDSAFLPSTITSEGKTVTAIYRPFGGSATPSCSASGWYFPKTQYTYYMVAEKEPFTFEKVSGKWVLTATLKMVNPDGYVQFWVEDASASSEDYLLSTDAVIPTGFNAVALDGTVSETADKSAGDAMVGYLYQGGLLFSGKLNPSYSSTGYYFIKTDSEGNNRRDYLTTGKTLASHSAVKLPANGDSKWLQVGSTQYIELIKEGYGSLGTWCTCNYDASLPEQVGTMLTNFDAILHDVPTIDQFQALMDNCILTWLTVNGQGGMAVKASAGFLFLPAQNDTDGSYWSSSSMGGVTNSFSIEIICDGSLLKVLSNRNNMMAVRPFQASHISS